MIVTNQISFVWDDNPFNVWAYYYPKDGSESILLGSIPFNQAQRTTDMYAWCDARIALLGLPPARTIAAHTGLAVHRPQAIGKLFGGD